MSFSTILVVEDYEPIRQLICLSLQEIGLSRIFEASDGVEAVQKAKEFQPELVLMDIGLPKLNGIEAAKRIRRCATHAKIIFISKECGPHIVQETVRVGARGYVHKPSVPTDLLPAIQAVLSGKRFVSSNLEFRVSLDSRHEVQ